MKPADGIWIQPGLGNGPRSKGSASLKKPQILAPGIRLHTSKNPQKDLDSRNVGENIRSFSGVEHLFRIARVCVQLFVFVIVNPSAFRPLTSLFLSCVKLFWHSGTADSF